MFKHSKRLIILLSSLSMVFSGCVSPGDGPEPRHDDDEIRHDDIFDKIELGPGEEIEDRSYYYSNHEYDVDPNYKVKVCAKEESNGLEAALTQNPENYFDISDNKGESYAVTVNSVIEDDKKVYLVSPAEGVYKEGMICHLDIKRNAANENDIGNKLFFKEKDPSMDRLYYNIKKEASSYRTLFSDVKLFDIKKVTYFSVPDGEYGELDLSKLKQGDSEEVQKAQEYFDNATFHFGYSDDSFSTLAVDKLFAVALISSTGQIDYSDDNTFYGKFVSCVKEGENYKITYKNADLTQVFKDENNNVAFSYTQKAHEVEMKNIKVETSPEKLRKEFAKNVSFRKIIGAIALASENESNSIDEILKHFEFSPSFSYHDKTLDIQIKISGEVPFGKEKTMAVKVTLLFQWSNKLDTDGDVEVETFLGIPYDINAHGTVTKTSDFTFSIEIDFQRDFDPYRPDDRPVDQKIKDAYKKLEDDPAYFMPRTGDDATYTNNHMSQPLVSLDVPFGYVFDFHIGLSFEFTIDLNVFFKYTYHTHEVTRTFAFTSDDGIENTSNSVSERVTSHNIDLGGKLYIEAGLRLTISIGIVGLKTLFQVGAYVEFGVYFQAQAMGGISWGDGQDTTIYGGIDIDVGFYGKISGFLDMLFVIHLEYNFAKGKWSWFGYNTPTIILGMFAEDLSLTQNRTPIEGTKLLTVKQFDVKTFLVELHTYQLKDTIKCYDDYVHPLSLKVESDYKDYVSFDSDTNEIVISDESPDYFAGKIKIEIHDDLYFSINDRSRTINFTFKRDGSNLIKFGEDDKSGLYLKSGREFVLPEVTPVTGLGDEVKFSEQKYVKNGNYFGVTFKFEYDPDVYDFLCYSDGKNSYYPGGHYVMPDHDVTFTVNLHKINYYQVKFYDNALNVIANYRVKEFTASPEPSEQERTVSGYTFVGWDRTFNYVTSDLDIYGIYVYGSSEA